MRTARLSLCAAAVATLAAVPAATGAGRVCHLVTDGTGDQRAMTDAVPGRPVPVSSDVDVVGGDVASNARYVTAAIRLATLRQTDTESPTGRSYALHFRIGKRVYGLSATYGPDGYSGSAEDVTNGVGLGSAGVVVDHAAREVRVTAPAELFGIKNGTYLSRITVLAGTNVGTNQGHGVPGAGGYSAWVGGGGVRSVNDEAYAGRAYAAGTPSCVRVAR